MDELRVSTINMPDAGGGTAADGSPEVFDIQEGGGSNLDPFRQQTASDIGQRTSKGRLSPRSPVWDHSSSGSDELLSSRRSSGQAAALLQGQQQQQHGVVREMVRGSSLGRLSLDQHQPTTYDRAAALRLVGRSSVAVSYTHLTLPTKRIV